MNADRSRMSIEPVLLNHLSPQMTKSPPLISIHKDPQSRQPMKIDHVENGHEGQSEPSQQL